MVIFDWHLSTRLPALPAMETCSIEPAIKWSPESPSEQTEKIANEEF